MGTVKVMLGGVETQTLRCRTWEVDEVRAYWQAHYHGRVRVEFEPDYSVLALIMAPEEKSSVLSKILAD